MASGTASIKSNATSEDISTVADLDTYASQVDGVFVVLVEPRPDRSNRRVFLSIAAAQAHAHRAADRGQTVRIFLCELRPLIMVAP